MRKILFRGCDGTGKWHEGSLIVIRVKKPVQKDVAPYEEYYIKGQAFGRVEMEVDPETIGQLVSPATKDHPDIWEGDIIEDEDGYRMEVIFDHYRHAFCLIVRSEGSTVFESLSEGYLYFLFNDGGAKIVGNIHDNPELITKPFS